ncbi:hypothetical protein [Streptomyces sp. NBC_01363]|uniref:hypothetical protein n=1 Tax=Streptomyces sp. NBC_01363 TaxID=2903840 RepID=UPI00225022C3|nr:hypothetical protein [Streptomyces sp. NBC_01363]MCX4734675.1 hypothetical protein [Streptomyces sp. NBC_01363]MCX4736834.1 hypothetical protein [Streptomyces sp. NBC_01363]MCX4737023.1 hypothetical protein [Streptomyces sp. NBC_01363]
MADVLVWVMQRRVVVLADRAERLRKELAGIDAEVARLEASEVVIGQFIEAERSGQADDRAVAEELERVTTAPGAGGMLLVPHREPGVDESALPADYQAIMKMVTAASEPVPAKDVSVQLGRGTQPGQVEPVRDKLRRLADRGWLHRTPAGRFTALPQPPV